MRPLPSAVREAVVLALLLSMAMALHSLERMVPLPQVAPGVKLGLANSASLVGLFVLPYSRILVLVVLRSLLASLFGGGPTVFVFSAVGGIVSATAMYLVLIRDTGLQCSIGEYCGSAGSQCGPARSGNGCDRCIEAVCLSAGARGFRRRHRLCGRRHFFGAAAETDSSKRGESVVSQGRIGEALHQ